MSKEQEMRVDPATKTPPLHDLVTSILRSSSLRCQSSRCFGMFNTCIWNVEGYKKMEEKNRKKMEETTVASRWKNNGSMKNRGLIEMHGLTTLQRLTQSSNQDWWTHVNFRSMHHFNCSMHFWELSSTLSSSIFNAGMLAGAGGRNWQWQHQKEDCHPKRMNPSIQSKITTM